MFSCLRTAAPDSLQVGASQSAWPAFARGIRLVRSQAAGWHGVLQHVAKAGCFSNGKSEMNIFYVVAGTGGRFLCDASIRDSNLVAGLRGAGHRVAVLPVYLPFDDDGIEEASCGENEIYAGATGVWIAQRFPWFGRIPPVMRRPLDSPRILRWAAARCVPLSQRPTVEMTLEMLKGEEGIHGRTIADMARRVSLLGRPDAVVLSASLLLGLAGPLRKTLKAPVGCFFHDELRWIQGMPEEVQSRVLDMLARRSSEADFLIAPSAGEAELVSKRLRTGEQRIHVVRPGIRTEGFAPEPVAVRPPTVGYAARMSDGSGLGVLVEAFARLKRQRPLLRTLRLRVTGGALDEDSDFLEGLAARLSETGMAGDVEKHDDFSRRGRLDFLHGLSAFSVPCPSGLAWNMTAMEAMAAGIPVVEPENGGAAELVRESGGGLVYDPSDIEQYTEALRRVLEDVEGARQMGLAGRKHVLANCAVERAAAELATVCEKASACLRPQRA